VIIYISEADHVAVSSLRALVGCANELPSAEYFLMEDQGPSGTLGNTTSALFEELHHVFGLQYEMLRTQVRIGYTHGLSTLARRAQGKYLLFLSPSALLCRGSLGVMLSTFSDHADVGLVGGKLLPVGGGRAVSSAIVHSDGHLAEPLQEPALGLGMDHVQDVDAVPLSFAMVRRTVWKKRSLLDLRYAPRSYEDVDLAFNVRMLGLRVLYQPFALAYSTRPLSRCRAHGLDDAYIAESEMPCRSAHRGHELFTAKWGPQLRAQMPAWKPCVVNVTCNTEIRTVCCGSTSSCLRPTATLAPSGPRLCLKYSVRCVATSRSSPLTRPGLPSSNRCTTRV